MLGEDWDNQPAQEAQAAQVHWVQAEIAQRDELINRAQAEAEAEENAAEQAAERAAMVDLATAATNSYESSRATLKKLDLHAQKLNRLPHALAFGAALAALQQAAIRVMSEAEGSGDD
jgi:hypothetical protein